MLTDQDLTAIEQRAARATPVAAIRRASHDDFEGTYGVVDDDSFDEAMLADDFNRMALADYAVTACEDITALCSALRAALERERVLRDVLQKFDEQKPCAKCGRRLSWRYQGDGTYAINCDDLLVHSCAALAGGEEGE